MAGRATRWFIAGALAAALVASGAQAQSGDPSQYCQGDGGPLGMASDAEHTVLLGEAPLPHGVRSRRLSVGGVATRVVEAGPRHARDAVVFVHGHPGSARDFDRLVSTSGRFARTVAFDVPGYGQSDKLAAQVQTTDGVADYIGAVLKRLGIRRVVLVVHDLGGPWGLQWAVKHPDALTGAVLMDGGVLIDWTPPPFAVAWETPGAGEMQMATTTRENFNASLKATNPRLPQAFLDRMYDNYDRPTRCAALRYYRDLSKNPNLGKEQAAVLRKRRRPALAIWGADDLFVQPDQAEKQKQAFPDAKVHLIAGTGHWVFADAPKRVRKLFVPFVRPRLAVRRPHPRAGARRLRVRVRVKGMLPAYRVRARIRTRRTSTPVMVRGKRTLTIRVRRPLHARRYSLRVHARGLTPRRLHFRARR
jgi:pimeloyl-ACP methyl ester carboxylesterase